MCLLFIIINKIVPRAVYAYISAYVCTHVSRCWCVNVIMSRWEGSLYRRHLAYVRGCTRPTRTGIVLTFDQLPARAVFTYDASLSAWKAASYLDGQISCRLTLSEAIGLPVSSVGPRHVHELCLFALTYCAVFTAILPLRRIVFTIAVSYCILK